MKIINLNSRYDLSNAHISFTESVIICGEHEPIEKDDSISILMNQIPIFLVNEKTQEENGNGDLLGFYQHSNRILGIETPVIGLCLEKIITVAKTDEELIILIAKVLIHEFAHAKMKLHPNANYKNVKDGFYEWMEEPMANLITLEYFDHFQKGCQRHRQKQIAHISTTINSFVFVKDFINSQPDNYRLGIDLFEHWVRGWWNWSYHKTDIEKKTKEKNDWLDYVKANVGNTDEATLKSLFDALIK